MGSTDFPATLEELYCRVLAVSQRGPQHDDAEALRQCATALRRAVAGDSTKEKIVEYLNDLLIKTPIFSLSTGTASGAPPPGAGYQSILHQLDSLISIYEQIGA